MNHSRPGLPVHHQLTESTQNHVHQVNDAIQPSHALLSPSLPAPILPSIRVFSNESDLCIRWSKYWSFSFNISPSNEHQGLTSFKMDWLDLLAVQGTLKSLLQHHSSIASILRAQLSSPSNSHIHAKIGLIKDRNGMGYINQKVLILKVSPCTVCLDRETSITLPLGLVG